jgi:hypothetical protein
MLIWLLLGGGAFVLLAVIVIVLALTVSSEQSADFPFSDRIQVVDVEGELRSSSSSNATKTRIL